jgi:hypothetical protein
MGHGRKLLSATAGLAAISYVVACDPKPVGNQAMPGTAEPVDAATIDVKSESPDAALGALAAGDGDAGVTPDPHNTKPPQQLPVKPHHPVGNLMAPPVFKPRAQ